MCCSASPPACIAYSFTADQVRRYATNCSRVQCAAMSNAGTERCAYGNAMSRYCVSGVPALRRPVRVKRAAVPRGHDGVDRRVDARQSVGPDGQHAVRFEHARHLAIECRAIKPVQRLRHRHNIDACVGQIRIRFAANGIGDVCACFGVCDLRGAGIGGDHLLEMRRKAHRCLPVSAAGIPRERPCRGLGCQPDQQCVRVLRAAGSVLRGHGREVV